MILFFSLFKIMFILFIDIKKFDILKINNMYMYILACITIIYCCTIKTYAQQTHFEHKIFNFIKDKKNINCLTQNHSTNNFFHNLNYEYNENNFNKNQYINMLYLPIKIQINNNSLNIMNQIYQNKEKFLFSQTGIQNVNENNVYYFGLGARTIHQNKYIIGCNLCYHSKFLNKSYQHLNIGAELFYNNFQLNINKYLNTIKRQLPQLFKNEENILNYGYYVTIQSGISYFPYLSGKIRLQKTSYVKINNILDCISIETNKNFITWMFGITYHPISLFCFNIDQIYNKNLRTTNTINISINYQINTPFKQQIKKINTNTININNILYNFTNSINTQTLINLNTKKQEKIYNKKQLYIEQKNNQSKQDKIYFYLPITNEKNTKTFLKQKLTVLNKNKSFIINESLNNHNCNYITIIYDTVLQKNIHNYNDTNITDCDDFNNHHKLNCNNIIYQNNYNNSDIEKNGNDEYHSKLAEIEEQQINTENIKDKKITIKNTKDTHSLIPIPPPLPICDKVQYATTNINNQSVSIPSNTTHTIFGKNINDTKQNIDHSASRLNQIQQNIIHHKTNKFSNLGNIEHLKKLENIEINTNKTKLENNTITDMIISKIMNRKTSLTYSDSENSSENNSIKNYFSDND